MVTQFHIDNPYVNVDDIPVTLNAGIIKQANLIAEYDKQSARRYLDLVTSTKYILRETWKAEKRYLRDFSQQERDIIWYRMTHPQLFPSACFVCGDYVDKDGYCCSRCQHIEDRIKSAYRAKAKQNKLTQNN
jgi:hypothetical protein